MRILTKNTSEYLPYSVFLSGEETDTLPLSVENAWFYKSKKNCIKKSFLDSLDFYINELHNSQEMNDIQESFCKAVREIINAENYQIFLCDEYNRSLLSAGNQAEPSLYNYLNKNFQGGGLNEIFENLMPALYKGSDVFNDFRKNDYGLIPLHHSGVFKGLIYLQAPDEVIFNNIDARKSIEVLFAAFLLKADSYNQKEKLKSLFLEIQSYQAKLLKDYRYSAIGEFTAGIIEEVLSGLQIILSSADQKITTTEGAESESILLIKEQVNKINNMLTNLARFASRNESTPEMKPIDLAQQIEEFCSLAEVSLKSKSYEIILEQDCSIPTVLSNIDQIRQLLTSIFSLLVKEDKQRGGIFIHTRCIGSHIVIRFLSTDRTGELLSDENDNINIRIIKKIMSDHHGLVETRTKSMNGSSITLHFPVIRQDSK